MRNTRTWGLIMILSGGLLSLTWLVGTVDVQADDRTAKPCEPGAFERADHFLRHTFTFQGELGLSEEQARQLGVIHQALKKDQVTSEADMRTIQGHLFPLLHNDNADLTAIEARFKQIESLRTGALMTAVKATREAQAVLTPEQRTKIVALLMQERQQSGQRREGVLPEGKERN
ncbi:MAG: Spy/CpxP family protein refolding chaperone [Nitrospira defluvii]|nr:Spy/CpxP family protein refolding chaperone [Nitrospira defluvii]